MPVRDIALTVCAACLLACAAPADPPAPADTTAPAEPTTGGEAVASEPDAPSGPCVGGALELRDVVHRCMAERPSNGGLPDDALPLSIEPTGALVTGGVYTVYAVMTNVTDAPIEVVSDIDTQHAGAALYREDGRDAREPEGAAPHGALLAPTRGRTHAFTLLPGGSLRIPAQLSLRTRRVVCMGELCQQLEGGGSVEPGVYRLVVTVPLEAVRADSGRDDVLRRVEGTVTVVPAARPGG